MAEKTHKIHGLLAKFNTLDDLIRATNRAYESGYRSFDAYSPFPSDELTRAMHLRSSYLPFVILAGGIFGAVGGFAMQWFATGIDYALNIGGRPYFSWPAYIPITFELTILFGAFAGVFGLFYATRFPQPYHPVFNSEDFNAHASTDAFYLGIEATDPRFDLDKTRQFLQGLGSVQVSEIEA